MQIQVGTDSDYSNTNYLRKYDKMTLYIHKLLFPSILS